MSPKKKRAPNRLYLIFLFVPLSLSIHFLFTIPSNELDFSSKQNELLPVSNRQETIQRENVDVDLSTLNTTNVQETNQTALLGGNFPWNLEGCQRRCHPDW